MFEANLPCVVVTGKSSGKTCTHSQRAVVPDCSALAAPSERLRHGMALTMGVTEIYQSNAIRIHLTGNGS